MKSPEEIRWRLCVTSPGSAGFALDLPSLKRNESDARGGDEAYAESQNGLSGSPSATACLMQVRNAPLFS